MPRIPGLPAILCMLFSPIMELRSGLPLSPRRHLDISPLLFRTCLHFPLSTDQDSTCFTGALCGLGWNSHTQEPVLVEHDMELAFDVRFDVEDITEVTAELDDSVTVCMSARFPNTVFQRLSI